MLNKTRISYPCRALPKRFAFTFSKKVERSEVPTKRQRCGFSQRPSTIQYGVSEKYIIRHLTFLKPRLKGV